MFIFRNFISSMSAYSVIVFLLPIHDRPHCHILAHKERQQKYRERLIRRNHKSFRKSAKLKLSKKITEID